MPNFVDDNTSLPFPKGDAVAVPSGSATTHLAAADWNTVCQALIDVRGKLQALAVTRDGPQDVIMPVTLAEWSAIGGGVIAPNFYWRAQESSGSITDEAQGATMAPSATPLYQQTLAGWLLKWLQSDAETATEGFSAAAGALWNSTVQSIVIQFYFRAVSAGGLRVLAMMSGADGYVSLNNLGILQLRGGGGAGVWTGTYNYFDGAEHFCTIEYILGAGVLGHTGPGVWRLSTDKEQLVGTWAAISDTTKGIGGTGGFTPPVAYYGPIEAWVGADAETISTVGIKAMQVQRGWTVSGY